MKERIKKIIFILLWFAGLVMCAALIKYYLPEWVYYTFLGLFLAWIVWDCSKPEKKEGKHYWVFTYINSVNGKITIGNGTQQTEEDYFDFCLFFSKSPSGYIINIDKINKAQYEKINDVIDKRNKEYDE